MKKKRYIIFLIVCTCLFSGCGLQTAMEDLAREHVLMDMVKSGQEEGQEGEVEPEVVFTAVPEPTTISGQSDGNYGIPGQDQENTGDGYQWNTPEQGLGSINEEDMDGYGSGEEEWEERNASEGDYIFPDSDTEKLTKADLLDKTSEELRLGRNEIYARHGRFFDDEELQEYFNGKSWYIGCIAPSEFVDSLELNDIERWNANFIRKYE